MAGAVPAASPRSRAEAACMRMSPRFAFRSSLVSPARLAGLGEAAVSLPDGCQRARPGRRAAAPRSGVGGELREYRSSRKTNVNRPFPSSVPSILSRTVPFAPLLL